MAEESKALELIQTGDGSSSLYHRKLDETYHSRHGAIAESQHVFIQKGLSHSLRHVDGSMPMSGEKSLSILEMGFGTGLNALLTLLFQIDFNRSYQSTGQRTLPLRIDYRTLEAYPLNADIFESLAYPEQLSCPSELFLSMHRAAWEQPIEIAPGFKLFKHQLRFEDFKADAAFDLVYYDAFGARVQPELWVIERFLALHKALRPGGVLVTYAAKGSVRRALQEVGFAVERLTGPPGKREMLRATKI